MFAVLAFEAAWTPPARRGAGGRGWSEHAEEGKQTVLVTAAAEARGRAEAAHEVAGARRPAAPLRRLARALQTATSSS